MAESVVEQVLRRYHHDPSRLMDILIDIQEQVGYLSDDTVEYIGTQLNLSTVDVEQTVSFYHFFAKKPRGKYTVYLNTSPVATMMGRERIAETFEREAGCQFGEVSEDGLIGLFDTPCIGMNDQEPAALINSVVFPNLTTFRVRELVRDMRNGVSVEDMRDQSLGDGMNDSQHLKATVNNNIRKKGAVIFSEYDPGAVVRKISENGITPEKVIETVKQAGIRGRGGAGFPTALKWDFCRRVDADRRFIFCNADEGEPGTFKDRVILTEWPRLVFDGMVLAGYAVNATEGILYLRYEYRYLRDYLEHILEEMRSAGTLGKNIGGRKGFDFDIRIQFGAGAYVCGEESGLIEPLGRQVLNRVARLLEQWGDTAPARIHLNVSPSELGGDARLAAELRRISRQHGVHLGRLCVEISERQARVSAEQVRRLRELGVQVALDDFGTGYASYSLLADLPITDLKLDGSLVRSLDSSERHRAVVRRILDLARDLGIRVVAEGVQTAAQAHRLREAGFRVGQGFLFSHPREPAEFEEILLTPIPRRSSGSSG